MPVSYTHLLEYGYGDKKHKASPVASTNDQEVITLLAYGIQTAACFL